MNIMSHMVVGSRITKGILPIDKRAIVILGSVLPDLNPKTQPHRGDNLLLRIYNSQQKVKTCKSDYAKALQLGILAHYICDYFCYAHSYNLNISHGIPHIKYEIAMQSRLKKGFDIRLSREYTRESLMKFIIEAKELYDSKTGYISRDLEYILTITEQAVDNLIGYFGTFHRA